VRRRVQNRSNSICVCNGDRATLHGMARHKNRCSCKQSFSLCVFLKGTLCSKIQGITVTSSHLVSGATKSYEEGSCGRFFKQNPVSVLSKLVYIFIELNCLHFRNRVGLYQGTYFGIWFPWRYRRNFYCTMSQISPWLCAPLPWAMLQEM
jgi:hypothetical protein